MHLRLFCQNLSIQMFLHVWYWWMATVSSGVYACVAYLVDLNKKIYINTHVNQRKASCVNRILDSYIWISTSVLVKTFITPP